MKPLTQHEKLLFLIFRWKTELKKILFNQTSRYKIKSKRRELDAITDLQSEGLRSRYLDNGSECEESSFSYHHRLTILLRGKANAKGRQEAATETNRAGAPYLPEPVFHEWQPECNGQRRPETYCLLLPVHDRLQLLEVPQFDLQFLHLCLNQEGDQGLDLSLFHGSQVLSAKDHSDYLNICLQKSNKMLKGLFGVGMM